MSQWLTPRRAIIIVWTAAIILFALGFAVPNDDPVLIDDPNNDAIKGAEITDGDTFDARFNGYRQTVRLLGVDTPETTQPPVPSEWEGVTSSSCLRSVGLEAKKELRNWLDKRARFKHDPVSDDSGYYGRTLGYVMVGDTNVNYWLVANGYARHYESRFSQNERFKQAERNARQENLGAWSCP